MVYRSRRKPTDFIFSVAKGDIPGYSIIHKFGRNSDVDTGSRDIIWDGGGSSYNWPTSACVLSLQSTSASDSSGSSGAQTVKLFGLDSNFDEIDEVVTLDGTSGVNSACNYSRIYRMTITAAGSTGHNHGKISACGNSLGLAYISPSNNQTLMAIYTIPNNCTGYLFGWYATTCKSSRGANMFFFVRPPNEVFQLKEFVSLFTTGNSHWNNIFPLPLSYNEKTDIYISACVTDNNSDIAGGFDILLVDGS